MSNHRPQGRRNELAAEKRSEIARLLRLGLPAARVILPKRCASKHLVGAVLESDELGPIVYSGGWKVDNRLSLNGFHHKRINHEKALANGKVPINGSESSRGYAKSLPRRLQTQLQTLSQRKVVSINHRDDENALNCLRSILRACS